MRMTRPVKLGEVGLTGGRGGKVRKIRGKVWAGGQVAAIPKPCTYCGSKYCKWFGEVPKKEPQLPYMPPFGKVYAGTQRACNVDSVRLICFTQASKRDLRLGSEFRGSKGNFHNSLGLQSDFELHSKTRSLAIRIASTFQMSFAVLWASPRFCGPNFISELRSQVTQLGGGGLCNYCKSFGKQLSDFARKIQWKCHYLSQPGLSALSTLSADGQQWATSWDRNGLPPEVDCKCANNVYGSTEPNAVGQHYQRVSDLDGGAIPPDCGGRETVWSLKYWLG